MKILITGATGFIGRRLVAALSAEGHELTGLSRDPERASGAVPGVRRFYTWEPADAPPPDAIAAVEAVIHLAGEPVAGRWTGAKKQRIRESRVAGTRGLVQALAAVGGNKTLVCASAVGYYGDRADEELTEGSPPGEGFLADVVREWEAAANAAVESGNRVAIMRQGIVLGPEGGALKQMLPLFRFGLGGPLGGGRQWWPWVHIDDVVRALQAAAVGGWQGTFNLTAPEPRRQRDFAASLAATMHRPALVPVPSFALRLAQGGFADELLFSKRVLPVALGNSGFQFIYPELGGALAQLLGKEARDAALPAHS